MPQDEFEQMMTSMCRLQQQWIRACMGAFLFGRLPPLYRTDPGVGVGVAVDAWRRMDHTVRTGQKMLGLSPTA